jgi:sugar lactone lactonase YvrE
VHQFWPADARLIEVTGKTSYAPWPNEAWNGAFASGPDVLNAPLGVQIDDRDRLWVLDNGLPLSPDQEPQAPKLVAFAIDDGQAVFRHDFAEEAGPAGSFLNDLAVDAGRGFVYFADLGRNAISLLGADGEQRILVQDERLSWPDALSFGEPRWLYVAVNQLHLSPPLNNGGEGGEPPFLILRLRTRDAGQAGR